MRPALAVSDVDVVAEAVAVEGVVAVDAEAVVAVDAETFDAEAVDADAEDVVAVAENVVAVAENVVAGTDGADDLPLPAYFGPFVPAWVGVARLGQNWSSGWTHLWPTTYPYSATIVPRFGVVLGHLPGATEYDAVPHIPDNFWAKCSLSINETSPSS